MYNIKLIYVIFKKKIMIPNQSQILEIHSVQAVMLNHPVYIGSEYIVLDLLTSIIERASFHDRGKNADFCISRVSGSSCPAASSVTGALITFMFQGVQIRG